MSEQHAGGCLCGAIRYRLVGTPTSTNICYCTQCQKQLKQAVKRYAEGLLR